MFNRRFNYNLAFQRQLPILLSSLRAGPQGAVADQDEPVVHHLELLFEKKIKSNLKWVKARIKSSQKDLESEKNIII